MNHPPRKSYKNIRWVCDLYELCSARRHLASGAVCPRLINSCRRLIDMANSLPPSFSEASTGLPTVDGLWAVVG